MGGCGPEFYPCPEGCEECSHQIADLGINKRYFLSAASNEPRKNILGFLSACARLPEETSKSYQFVLVSSPTGTELEHILRYANDIGIKPGQLVLTGHVHDQLLRCLYACCEAFVFPSFHEGFGLPVLEAMQCGAPTIASNATSIPEILGRRDATFDPTRVDEIAALMTRIARDPEFRTGLRQHGLARAQLFTWTHAAEAALAAMRELVANQRPNKQAAVAGSFAPTRYEQLINSCAGALVGASAEDKAAVAGAIARNTAQLDRLPAVASGRSTRLKQAESPPLRTLTPPPLTSAICREADFVRSDFHRWMDVLKEKPRYHRKLWEFFFVAQALQEQGLLAPGRSGVGFGVGTEPLPAAFAALGVSVLASDQGIEEAMRAGWAATDQHTSTVDALNDRRDLSPRDLRGELTISRDRYEQHPQRSGRPVRLHLVGLLSRASRVDTKWS